MAHDPVSQAKAGLARLKAAVQDTQIERTWQHARNPATFERTAAFCRLWTPMDTYQSFAAAHPEWGHQESIHARMGRIRRKVPGLPKSISLAPYQIAQAYLASLPEHYRRPTND